MRPQMTQPGCRSCATRPCIDDNKFRRFIPDQTIWRSVSLDTDHKWKYRVTRNVDSNTIILPNQ